MNKILEDHCETIDAAIFTGDFLTHPSHRRDLQEYCERWLREIASYESGEKEPPSIAQIKMFVEKKRKEVDAEDCWYEEDSIRKYSKQSLIREIETFLEGK